MNTSSASRQALAHWPGTMTYTGLVNGGGSVGRSARGSAGTAAGAHLTAHEGWSRSYAEMHDALVRMRRKVRTAAANYAAAAEANTAMWSSVR